MTQTITFQNAPSVEDMRRLMTEKLAGIVPDFEITEKAEYAFKINRLKREKNAVILGHNYMEPSLFLTIPDYAGDSLQLARISAQTDADVIVFCGVTFMAETAKILNPEKTVLCPAEKAGCSLAEGITAEDVKKLREIYQGAPVVTYVNTYADVKAESDYCCTSGNAGKVVAYLFEQGHEHVLFLPDEFLARNTAHEMGIAYVDAGPVFDGEDGVVRPKKGESTIIGWKARCEVHELFTVEDVQNVRKQFPDVVILAHPECPPEVIEVCDISGSTKVMADYVRDVDAPRYLLLTECAMGDNLAAMYPQREMLRLCSLRCEHMNTITLQDTLLALEKMQYKIELPEDLMERARLPIERMLSI